MDGRMEEDASMQEQIGQPFLIGALPPGTGCETTPSRTASAMVTFKSQTGRVLLTSLIAAAIAMWSGVPTSAFAAQDCAALANLKINNTNLLSAAEVPADGDLPAYCRVLGYVRPAINFEIKLPLQAWNGKFYMVGCGGFCGTVNSEARGFSNAMNFGLRRNYAVSASDSGH